MPQQTLDSGKAQAPLYMSPIEFWSALFRLKMSGRMLREITLPSGISVRISHDVVSAHGHRSAHHGIVPIPVGSSPGIVDDPGGKHLIVQELAPTVPRSDDRANLARIANVDKRSSRKSVMMAVVPVKNIWDRSDYRWICPHSDSTAKESCQSSCICRQKRRPSA